MSPGSGCDGSPEAASGCDFSLDDAYAARRELVGESANRPAGEEHAAFRLEQRHVDRARVDAGSGRTMRIPDADLGKPLLQPGPVEHVMRVSALLQRPT